MYENACTKIHLQVYMKLKESGSVEKYVYVVPHHEQEEWLQFKQHASVSILANDCCFNTDLEKVYLPFNCWIQDVS